MSVHDHAATAHIPAAPHPSARVSPARPTRTNEVCDTSPARYPSERARARARSLGYLAGEVSQTSFVRVGLAGLTLALGWGAAGMWAVAAWSWTLTASRVLQVRKEELA